MPRPAQKPSWQRDPIPFGILNICQRKLANGVLSVQHASKSNVKGFGVKQLSEPMKRTLQSLVAEEDGKAVEHGARLSSEEREWLKKLSEKARVSIPSSLFEGGGGAESDSEESDDDDDQDELDAVRNRFEILTGELRLGNKSADVVSELNSVIQKMLRWVLCRPR